MLFNGDLDLLSHFPYRESIPLFTAIETGAALAVFSNLGAQKNVANAVRTDAAFFMVKVFRWAVQCLKSSLTSMDFHPQVTRLGRYENS
jgi:hypothetical protein